MGPGHPRHPRQSPPEPFLIYQPQSAYRHIRTIPQYHPLSACKQRPARAPSLRDPPGDHPPASPGGLPSRSRVNRLLAELDLHENPILPSNYFHAVLSFSENTPTKNCELPLSCGTYPPEQWWFIPPTLREMHHPSSTFSVGIGSS